MAGVVASEVRRTGGSALEGPVGVGIHVSKPSHRCDAVNVVKQVCDAVRDAIGIDDNWFGLDGLSWDVRPPEPALVVRVRQDVTVPCAVCAECGSVVAAAEIRKRSRCSGCLP